MKYVKMLGLAAVAAMALMAFVGAGTASATVLCETSEHPTNCTKPYPKGTTIDATLEESAILETLGGTVLDTCTGSTVKGKTANAGGENEPVTGNIESLTWENCSRPTTTIVNGSLQIEWIPVSNNGVVSGKESQVTIATIFGSCTYGLGAGTTLGTLIGGAEATIKIDAVVAKIAGNISCPAEARWTAAYKVTEPKPLWVSTH